MEADAVILNPKHDNFQRFVSLLPAVDDARPVEHLGGHHTTVFAGVRRRTHSLRRFFQEVDVREAADAKEADAKTRSINCKNDMGEDGAGPFGSTPA